MNIKRAKEEIEHTVKAYLAKDALGEYAIPAIRQRPILLMGPPGIGKTQVMEQVARECGVALVAYTITHHTRQSAVGLPFIRQRHYGDKDVSVTEYTMSEIIASVYAKMEATGLSEGILFIDEINCVSETLGLKADEDLIREYIQHQKIAEDFSAYLDLYYKYRDDYGVEDILAGQVKPAVYARLLNAPFDERLSLVSLILAGLDTRFTASRQQDAVADACYAFLRQAKQGFATVPEDIPDGPAVYFSQMVADYDAETQKQRAAGLLSRDALNTRLRVDAVLRAWEAELRRAKAVSTQPAFDLLRTQFQSLAEERENAQNTASAALEAAFDFMEQAFAESQEMVVFVTELTLSPAAHAFITENGCERYFQYNKDLLLDHRKAALQQELAAEERCHGGI